MKTSATEWVDCLSHIDTFLWYDAVCVPRKLDLFKYVPVYICRSDFMVVLVPGCTHFDRIDRVTQRNVNLCYRTYRLRARCVFEMFSALLSANKPRPMLLVRSGTGRPCWTSPLECIKLAVGMSKFECCETNHAYIKTCRRPIVRELLRKMIRERALALFLEMRACFFLSLLYFLTQYIFTYLYRYS